MKTNNPLNHFRGGATLLKSYNRKGQREYTPGGRYEYRIDRPGDELSCRQSSRLQKWGQLYAKWRLCFWDVKFRRNKVCVYSVHTKSNTGQSHTNRFRNFRQCEDIRRNSKDKYNSRFGHEVRNECDHTWRIGIRSWIKQVMQLCSAFDHGEFLVSIPGRGCA